MTIPLLFTLLWYSFAVEKTTRLRLHCNSNCLVSTLRSRIMKATVIQIARSLLGLSVFTAVLMPPVIALPQPANPELKADQLTPSQLIELVWQIVDQAYLDPRFNGQNWQALRQQYLNRSYPSSEAAYQAVRDLLARLGDPYTHFVSPAEYRSLQLDPAKTGTGIQFVETKHRQITVVAPTQGSPAAIAGVLPQDILKTINGQPVQGLGVYRVANLLRGKPGTPVKLVVQRGSRDIALEVIHQNSAIAPIRYQVQTVAGTKVGFIQVNQLSSQAISETQTAIQTLEKQGVKGYILNLRSNPGGNLESAIAMAQLWLHEGKIVSIVRRRGDTQTESATQSALTDKPLVVLVDRGTANAAEILAATLQDRGRAKLVGTPTFGNSHIQSLRPLPNGSAISVTVAKWLMPSGKDVHGTGLQPDLRVELTPEQQRTLLQDSGKTGTEIDPQYLKAAALLTKQITITIR
jgi:carboxyl-terminal processing protease